MGIDTLSLTYPEMYTCKIYPGLLYQDKASCSSIRMFNNPYKPFGNHGVLYLRPRITKDDLVILPINQPYVN